MIRNRLTCFRGEQCRGIDTRRTPEARDIWSVRKVLVSAYGDLRDALDLLIGFVGQISSAGEH